MTPVFGSSRTRRGVEPPNHSYIDTWARSHEFCAMPSVGSTNAYRLNGGTAANGYAVDESPVTGSTIRKVLPARSTSMARPALCSTLPVTSDFCTYAAYGLQNRS